MSRTCHAGAPGPHGGSPRCYVSRHPVSSGWPGAAPRIGGKHQMNVTARRSAAVLTAVVLGSAALTACGPEDSSADTGAAKPTATASHLPVAPSAHTTTPAPVTGTAAPVHTGVTPAAKVKLPSIPVKPGCSNKRPTPEQVDPHTFAVYRYETIPGDSHINL